MSDLNPYEQLEVAEDASFEDIQTARDRLLQAYQGDEQVRQQVEVAYDSILMDRLRKRQEGKIKVPEGIRFAERLTDKPAKVSNPQANPSLPWLQRTMDTPTSKEVGLLGGVYAVLAGVGILTQQGNPSDPTGSLSFLLTLGFGISVFWLNRKENKLGRAFLLSIAALVVGGLIGVVFWKGLQSGNISLDVNLVVTIAVSIVLWLVSGFLR